MTGSFLEEPPVSAQVQVLYDEDLADGATCGTCPGCGRTSQAPSGSCSG